MAHFHDDHDGYAELNLKEDKPGWQKSKSVERFYVKYDTKNNLPAHEYTIPNQIEREFNSLASGFCVTNKANQNLIPS